MTQLVLGDITQIFTTKQSTFDKQGDDRIIEDGPPGQQQKGYQIG